jgi:S-adenosylmethionine decarboxylase
MITNAKGQHILIDAWDVSERTCIDVDLLLETLVQAAEMIKATIVSWDSKRFTKPPGATVFVMLDESHFSIHTYSDLGIIAADLFACGNKDLDLAFRHLIAHLKLNSKNLRFLRLSRLEGFADDRGRLSEDGMLSTRPWCFLNGRILGKRPI